MRNSPSSDPFSTPPADLLEILFQQLPVGVALFDTEGILVRCNPLFADLMERFRGDQAGRVAPGIRLADIYPGDETACQGAIRRVLAGETVRADSVHTLAGGVEAYWDGLLSPVVSNGRLSGMLAIVVDVTERSLAALKVQESEATLRSMVENAQQFALYRIELDPSLPYGGRLVFTSPSIGDIVGNEDPNRFEGWFEQIHPDDKPRVLAANQRSLEMGIDYDQVCRVFNPRRNSWAWVHTISRPFRDSSGKITYFDGMVIDLTDQVTLREAERRRAAAEGLRDIVRMINSNQPLADILQSITAHAKVLLGASSTMIRQVCLDENMVRTVASCDLPPDFDAIREQPFYRAASDQSLLHGDPVIITDIPSYYTPMLNEPLYHDPLRRAGLEVTIKHYHSLLKTPLFLKGQLFGAITFHYTEPRDFSEEDLQLATTLADQATLAIENARLIEKAKETAVLEERNRLARELHDAVTQTLFSTTLTAEVLPKIWKKDPAEGHKKLEELRELTRGALAEMRTLLVELRPAALEEARLADLLRHLTNAFIARARIPVATSIEEGVEIPLDVKIAFYRVAQEALNNVAHHAEATHVAVILDQDAEEVFLKIQDDGVGFDPSEARSAHFGLGIMRERASQAGADLCIQSRPGEGAVIFMRWRRPA